MQRSRFHTYRAGGVNAPRRARDVASAALTVLLAAAPAAPAAEPEAHTAENRWVTMRLVPRTPDQMAAFYEARGFPSRAIESTREACFVTAIVRNRSEDVVWLEPARWRFADADGEPVPRRDEAWWRARWKARDIPRRHRATFGWTLLPERRDLHLDEPVGGNVTLDRPDTPVTVEARFVTGQQRDGQEFTLRFDDVRCSEEET